MWIEHHRRGSTRKRYGWLCVLVFAAVCSLTLSLATRYSPWASSSVRTGQSVLKHTSPEAGRQHLDKDADGWVSPVPRLTTLTVPTLCLRAMPSGPPTHDLHYLDEGLYNRPPPSPELDA
jgi:hypothetical protein